MSSTDLLIQRITNTIFLCPPRHRDLVPDLVPWLWYSPSQRSLDGWWCVEVRLWGPRLSSVESRPSHKYVTLTQSLVTEVCTNQSTKRRVDKNHNLSRVVCVYGTIRPSPRRGGSGTPYSQEDLVQIPQIDRQKSFTQKVTYPDKDLWFSGRRIVSWSTGPVVYGRGLRVKSSFTWSES